MYLWHASSVVYGPYSSILDAGSGRETGRGGGRGGRIGGGGGGGGKQPQKDQSRGD